MSLPSRSEYAAIAVYELSLAYQNAKPLSAQKIATKHGLSTNFLLQILHSLRQANLVETVRGSKGGFRLLSSPEEVTLGYVLSIAEKECKQVSPKDPTTLKKEGLSKNNLGKILRSNPSKTSIQKKLDEVWKEAEIKRQEYLNSILFSDLISNTNNQSPTLHFSI